ncbi:uncharacterized protein LOC131424390 [Marmota monax]|uniref:uncharacterized protein LOC131424390 n=1 Tax=Marmota monax TaxID=9995 RepID=UPI0026EF9F15|nr:uncharacterized protein LOC131424390 [Marmota monax]
MMRPFILLSILALSQMIMVQMLPMQWWAVARTWPMPMLVHKNSSVLPTLFSISCEMSAPCVSPRGDRERVFNLSRVNLTGVFCFSFLRTRCIRLQRNNLTNWEDPLQNSRVSLGTLSVVLNRVSNGEKEGSGETTNSTEMNITTLAIISQVSLPVAFPNASNATYFKASPYCTPYYSFPPTFMPCQDHSWEKHQVAVGFSLSPSLKRYLYNSSKANSTTGTGWSWFQWLISNEKGATADVSALAQLRGVQSWLFNVSGSVQDTANGRRLKNISYNSQVSNATLPSAAVCLHSPFLFLLTNDTNTTGSEMIDCSNCTYVLSECWNGSWSTAVVMKVPTFVPIPVTADPDSFPIVEVLRSRRDFGITAAIVTAVAVSAAAAVTAGVAMANQVQTAATVNQVIQQTSNILESQSKINQHILSGILAVNQRVDLLQAQIEELSDLVHLGCVDHHAHLCITSLRFNDSRNTSQIIGQYLAGNWSMEAEKLIQTQLTQIAMLNNTRVDPVTLGQFTNWLSSAFSFFKEWVGVGIFGAMCCFGVVLCLWLFCRLGARHSQEKAMIVQAFAALENGISPQVWLAQLKQ